MNRPRVTLTKNDVVIRLTNLRGEPVSSALSHDEAAKLAVDIAHVLAFPWRNRGAQVQFCPRHPERLIVCGAYCDMCAADVSGARDVDSARTTS